MRFSVLAFAALLALAACTTSPTTQQAAATAGQLFCAVQLNGGGAVVAGLVKAEAIKAGPAAPVAVIATDMGKAYVDAMCAAAGGIPVSPPANPAAVPQIAVKSG